MIMRLEGSEEKHMEDGDNERQKINDKYSKKGYYEECKGRRMKKQKLNKMKTEKHDKYDKE